MPAPYGVTPTGYSRKTFEEIEADIRAAMHSDISPSLDLGPDSIDGQQLTIYASNAAELHELGEAIYNSIWRGSASGRSLTLVGRLTGTQREAARKAEARCSVNLNPGTYAIGALVAHPLGRPENRFSNAEQIIVAGGSPITVTGLRCVAEVAGQLFVSAGQLAAIASPVSGFNSITNPNDAVAGKDVERDTDLRIRSEEELRAIGGSTPDAIRADLLDVEKIKSVSVFENRTSHALENGQPPNSFEVVVYDGTDAGTSVDDETIAKAIYASGAAGIETFGDASFVVTKPDGGTETVRFSRPSVVQVYARITVIVRSLSWDPVAGPAAISAAIVAHGDASRSPGDDVVTTRFYGPTYSVAGVEDAVSIEVRRLGGSFSTASLAIGPRELATFDTSRVSVVVSGSI